jgi:hypothetical protein
METDSVTEESDQQPDRAAEELFEITEPEGFIQRIAGFFKKPETFTFLGALLLFCGLLWFGPEAIENFKTGRDFLRELLAGAFRPPATGEISPLAIIFFVLILGAVFVSTLYGLVTNLATRGLRRNLRQRAEKERQLAVDLKAASSDRDLAQGALAQAVTERESLLKLLQSERTQAQSDRTALQKQMEAIVSETVRTVSKISRQMFPAIAGVKGKTFRFVRYSYHLSRDFSAEVHRRCTIRAGDAPLHLWVSSVNASSDSEPAATFADIQFRLISRDINSEVVYLPAENDRFSKFACVFFLPPVPPGQEREVELVYRWTGLFLGLQRNRWEDFSYPLKSAGTIEEFELEVFLEDGTGGYLTGSEIGVKLPGSTVTAASNDRGWQGFRYRATNIPPELLSEEIAARVEWKRT